MLRIVRKALCIYLIAMCIVSAFTWIFSDLPLSDDPSVYDSPPTTQEHSSPKTVFSLSESDNDSSDNTQEIASTETETSPTSSIPPLVIEVKVHTKECIGPKPKHISDPILKVIPPDITGITLEELEKRKKFIVRICMRRFCRAYTDREEDNSKWNKKLLAG